MKKFLAFVMAASMALSLAACGGSSASTATSTMTEATSEAAASTSGSKTDVAFVTDVGNIDDQSFNQYTWQGVQDFCSANSLNANYYRPTEDSDAARLEQMDNAVNDGAKSIVVAGFLFGNAMNDSLTRRLTAMFGNANYAVTVNSSDLSDEELNEAYSSTVGDFHLDQIAGIEGVDGVRASVETGASVSKGDSTISGEIISTAAQKNMLPVNITEGDQPKDSNEVALPEDMAKQLNLSLIHI